MRTIAFLALLVLSACNARFIADFEGDSTGAPPALNPPGFPDDEIVIADSAVDGGGIVVRVTDEPQFAEPGQEHRFMSLIREPDPGLSSTASLRSAPMSTGTQSLFLQWEQVLDGGGSGSVILFPFPEGPTSDIESCRVTTGNDIISLSCSLSDMPAESGEIGGIDTQSPHTLLMRIDRAPRRATLSAVQDDVSTPAVTVPVDALAVPVEGQRLVAQIEYDGQSDGAYRFNSFGMQERDPN